MRKKVSFLPIAVMMFVVATVGFSSCLKDVGNITSEYGLPAVVVSSTSGTVLNVGGGNIKGYVSVPELDGKVSPGDYLYVALSVDWDNQKASSQYYCQASLLAYDPIDHDTIDIVSGPLLNDEEFNDSIVTCLNSAGEIGLNFVGDAHAHRYSFLMQIWHRAPSKQAYEYKLVCNPDSTVKDVNGDIYMFYLLANKAYPVQSGTLIDDTDLYGFDVSDFFALYGTPGKELKFNIKYIVGKNAQGQPIYKPIVSKYYSITIFEDGN